MTPLPLRHDRLVTRILGVGMGAGFLALGVMSVLGGGRPWTDAIAGERTLALGLTLIVAGVAAIVASLTVRDPSRVW